ncbi:MAG: hypothetical protein QOE59_4432 [Actinomycetota bacterium]|nr:hypothetical protein [Actinomycetota bacterium]
MAEHVPDVLFVRVHNAGRSQMAAALLAHDAGDQVRVGSAGSAHADEVNPAVREVMAEIGIGLSREVPTRLNFDDVDAADVVITVGCGDACPAFPASATSTGNSPTPPARTRTRCDPSATTSTAACASCSTKNVGSRRCPSGPVLESDGAGGGNYVRVALPFVIANGDGAIGMLGDPNRRALFELLARRPSSVGELAVLLPISRPAVSQHLKVLKDGGLVVSHADGNRRVYRLNPDGVSALRAWLDGVWNDALTSYHKAAQADPTDDIGDQP